MQITPQFETIWNRVENFEVPKEAIQCWRKAYELSPEPKYAYTLAYYLQATGESKKAMRILEPAQESNPAHEGIFFLLADLYPATMVEFYKHHGRELFHARMRPRGWLRLVVRLLERVPGVGSLVDDVDSLFLPKWSIHGLETQIREFFGATPSLRDVPKTVLLPALKLEGKGEGDEGSGLTAVCMHNFEGSPYADTPVHSALLRSMAAPVYFASHEGYVDGGLFAANPCIAALGAAVASDKGNRELSSVCMLSVGAGICPDGIPYKGRLTWGLLKWGPRIMDASVNGVAEFDCDQARALLSERFCRLNVVLPRTFALDDYREIPTLARLAEEAIESRAFDEVARFVERSFGATA